MAIGFSNAGLSGNPAVDALLSGRSWQGPLSYGFPDDAQDYAASYGRGEPLDGFAPATPGIVGAVREILVGGGTGSPMAAVSQFTGLELAEAGPGEGGDIRVAQSGTPATAWAYLPGVGEGGDVWLGTGHDYRTPLPGGFAHLTLLHELGHSLGLKHADEAGGPSRLAVPEEMDGLEFTVMSYRSVAGSGTAAATGWSFEPYGAPQSLMMLDIAALQHLYGADFGHNGTDTCYSWDPDTGASYVNGELQVDAPGNRILQTVWDGGGRDLYDLSNYAGGVSVDLRPGAWSVADEDQLAWLGPGVRARGNICNALLYRGDPRSLIEDATGGSGDDSIQGNDAANRLAGGDGHDVLIGGAGDDTLDGGAGDDTAVFDGSRSGYVVGRVGEDGLSVAAPDGTDLVTGVEWFRFADGLYSAAQLLAGDAPTATAESGPAAAGNLLSVTVSSGGVASQAAASPYSGPVAYLQYQFLGTAAGEAVVATAGNDFVNLLGGDDAAAGGTGRDVLDGGTGSNFLSGGDGWDVFFLDGRSGQAAWSTVTDWQQGEQLSLWGWRPGVSKATWADGAGMEGYRGVTMHADLDADGVIDTSVTWTGKARADLPAPTEHDGLLWFA